MTRTEAPRFALVRLALAALAVAGTSTSAAVAQKAPAPAQSAPLANLRYEITFDSTTAETRTLKVAMSFDVAGPGPVLLSLPAWTPGAYELTWFARWVANFTPDSRGPLAGVGQARLRHLAHPAGRRQVGQRPVRLPGRHARQRDGLGPAELRVLQRHERPALSRGPGPRFPRDGRDPDRAVVARRDRHAERAAAGGNLPRRELPRPRGQAVLRRTDGLRQHAGRGRVDPARHLPRRRCSRARRGRSCGTTSAR